MKIHTLALLYKLLQDEKNRAEKASRDALTRLHELKAQDDPPEEEKNDLMMIVRVRKKEARSAAVALDDFEEQEWGTREPRLLAKELGIGED